MSVWTSLNELASAGVRAFSGVIDRLTTALAGDPEERRRLAFSAAMIGLSAKMAKADGVVSRDEVSAFGRLVEVPPSEAEAVARLFNLARQDVAGYRSYARKIAGLYPPDDPVREDILDGLFTIATADGLVHPAELAYLGDVAMLLQIEEQRFEQIKARHVLPVEGDPYPVLGADRSMSDDELRRRYRDLVRDNHPDTVIGQRLPPEFVVIATKRLAAITTAWSAIRKERGL